MCSCVRVCRFAYAHVCMHVCMSACHHLCMYACMHVCMHVCEYACMHVCIDACTHVCMHKCMFACLHVCMFACLHAYMHVCVSVHVCVYHMHVYACEHLYACVHVQDYSMLYDTTLAITSVYDMNVPEAKRMSPLVVRCMSQGTIDPRCSLHERRHMHLCKRMNTGSCEGPCTHNSVDERAHPQTLSGCDNVNIAACGLAHQADYDIVLSAVKKDGMVLESISCKLKAL